MHPRRSLEPNTAKPFNINIYYNINSRNITNNHEVQSHPVTARLLNPKTTQDKGKGKNIANLSVKTRKKKYSVDLTMPTDKKAQKGYKKSNTNSICSGFQSQNNYKRETQKPEQDRKALSTSINQKHEQKLGKLLEIFSQGKIDKVKLTKEILAVFQLPLDSLCQDKKQKIPKKKRSVSTLFGTTTPKNNRMAGAGLKNTMNIHKARHRQSKSEKGSFMNSKTAFLKDEIAQKIIECKVIDSSLCLQPDDDEKQLRHGIIDRANDVLTSYSIVLLNENIKKQRNAPRIQQCCYSSKEHEMAAIIQKAWRKYKTRKLITKIINPPKMQTDQNSMLQKVQCVSSSKKSLSVQNFLSQQLSRKNTTIRNAEIARVEQLRDHEIKKWSEITQFVKTSMNNRSQSSDECLKSIIAYFENAKSQVEKELMLDRVESSHNAYGGDNQWRQDRRQLTQFTNQICSREIVEEQQYQQSARKQGQNVDVDEQKSGEEESENDLQQVEEDSQEGMEHEPQSSNNQVSQQLLLQSSRVKLSPDEQILKSINNSQNLSLEIVQNAMIIHLRKLQLQYCTKIKNLDINTKGYLESKKKIDQQFKQQRKQIRRIIANLNKGYQQAKSILNKQDLQSFEESQRHVKSNSSNETLQKCKSDNYLLKTAINYKKYVERKEGLEQHKNQSSKQRNLSKLNQKVEKQKKQQTGFQCQSSADQQILKIKQQIIRKLAKTHLDDNLQYNGVESEDLSENSMGKSLHKIVNEELRADSDGYAHQNQQSEEDLGQNRSLPFGVEVQGSVEEDEGGDGQVKNKNQKCTFNKLEQKIVSEQFLQYQQIRKQFDPDLQHSISSLKSNSNSPSGPHAEEISLFQNTKINETNKKLKYLTNEDKDDIFQFVFIDLTLELITECDHETKVYKAIRSYVDKRKRLESIPKGVKTAIAACKDYLGVISQSVQRDHLEMFKKHIMVPMGPTAKEMLKYMHEDEGDEFGKCLKYVEQQNNTEVNVPLILPNAVFEKLENRIVVEYPRFYDDDTKEQSRRKFLKSIDHIHHKALFDSLNESLDAERPYGVWGLPFPWKTTHKNKRKFECDSQQKILKLKSGIQKVIQCCSYMCGILVDKEESVFGNHKVSQGYVDQIRQDRMSKMLSNQLHENEDRWAFYDDEQTEVLIQLSKLMVISLAEQAASELNSIKRLL